MSDFQNYLWCISSKENKNEFNIKVSQKKRTIKHEVCSFLLIASQPIGLWLWSKYPQLKKTVLIAVLADHRRINYKNLTYLGQEPIKLNTNHPEFKKTLELGVQYFGLSPELPKLPTSISKDCADKLPKTVFNFLQKADSDLLTASLKSLVMAADLAGSALLTDQRQGRSLERWISEALETVLSKEEALTILLESVRGSLDNLYEFQRQARDSNFNVVVITSGCGGGKSGAGYARHLGLAERGIERKLFFNYPTTATTTQGYLDYVFNKVESAYLAHSRVWVDENLRGFSRLAEDDEDDDILPLSTQVEALQLWVCKVTYCTAHTTLGLLQNFRKGLYGYPGLLCGHHVFDEAGSYSPELFGSLLIFLKLFPQIPVTILSATIPEKRLKALQAVTSFELIPGNPEVEAIKRYRIYEYKLESIWHSVKIENTKAKKPEEKYFVSGQVGRALCFDNLAGGQPFYWGIESLLFLDKADRERVLKTLNFEREGVAKLVDKLCTDYERLWVYGLGIAYHEKCKQAERKVKGERSVNYQSVRGDFILPLKNCRTGEQFAEWLFNVLGDNNCFYDKRTSKTRYNPFWVGIDLTEFHSYLLENWERIRSLTVLTLIAYSYPLSQEKAREILKKNGYSVGQDEKGIWRYRRQDSETEDFLTLDSFEETDSDDELELSDLDLD